MSFIHHLYLVNTQRPHTFAVIHHNQKSIVNLYNVAVVSLYAAIEYNEDVSNDVVFIVVDVLSYLASRLIILTTKVLCPNQLATERTIMTVQSYQDKNLPTFGY